MANLSALYQQSMLKHPYGYALYESESSKTLQPGFCGYLTELGHWTPLLGIDNTPINLGDPSSLAKNGLTSFEQFHRAPSDERAWGPKLCGEVKQQKIDLEASASLIPAGIPADIGALYRYSSTGGFGAILMTQSPVVKEFVYGATAFRVWCKANSAAILQKWPDVRERGLIIVTSIYTTQFAMMDAWVNKEKEFSVGFRAALVEIGEVGPSTTWYTSSSEGGWVSAAASGPDERKVVFFGGLCFKYRRLAAILPQSHAFSATPIETTRFRDIDEQGREFRIVDQDGDDSFEVMVTSEDCGEIAELPGEAGEDEDDF